ncbi:hypothetical protein [Kineococcus sp. SYSU DK005]|uniref:hypothetical protein n=1 Tax=Kineococcus sp. SYSU DK005 TaxID=3383126 RepID=UPI003D7EF8F8
MNAQGRQPGHQHQHEPDHTHSNPHELDATQITHLLTQLHQRLHQRGVAAALFIVGGAAIAATGLRTGRLTQDVDALSTPDTLAAVLDEARALATEHHLPTNWLNPAAALWMPPLPAGALTPPHQPGLRITYADDAFLLATKLLAQRAKDADDILALTHRLGLHHPSAQQLHQHIRRYYTDPEQLTFLLDGVSTPEQADEELALLAGDAARMLHRHHQQQDYEQDQHHEQNLGPRRADTEGT